MAELLKEGKGTFVIKAVVCKTEDGEALRTKAGDRKVMIVLKVTDANNMTQTVYEHITMKASWKIESICKAVGMPHLYVSPDTCLDGLEPLDGRRGECTIVTQEAQNGYPECSKIGKYLPPKKGDQTPIAVLDVNDDIPF